MGVMRWLSGRPPYRDVVKVRVDDLEDDMIGADVTLDRRSPAGYEVLITGALQSVEASKDALQGDKVITIGGIEIHVDDDEKLEVTLP